jgi:beta-galactosidase
MVGRNGLPVAYEAQSTCPADGKPGPCYDHPGARADMVRFVRELVRVLGRYENIVVWNTWQEVAYWPERLAGQHVCYCDHTLDHYRCWLREKYGDLDGLNRAWNSRYLDWSYVVPNRSARGRDSLAHDVDWFYFMDNIQVGRVLRTRAAAIRDADPLQRPVFAHTAPPEIGTGQYWHLARCQDFLGASAYPAWWPLLPWDDGCPGPGQPPDRHTALLAEMWSGVAVEYDYVRSFNPRGAPVWAAEFQGGPVSTFFHKGRGPSPADVRRWMLTAVGCGVTAISFWVTRAEIMACEMNGFSLLDSEGDTTDRFEEASRIGRALNQHPDLFGRPTWPGADVAILVNERNYQFCQTLLQGRHHIGFAIRGWHRLLWDLGIPMDFVEASELDEPYIRDYRALVVPFPLSMSEDVAAQLVRYVEQGGNLICEAAPGRIDEHAYAVRGELSATMRALFGVRQTSFTMVAEPDGGSRWSPAPRTWGEYLQATELAGAGLLAGHRVRASAYIETFDCLDSEPVLSHGDAVAGVVHEVGSGRAWLLGTYVGHSGTAYRGAETQAFVRALLGACEVAPSHAGRLLLRRRTAGTKEAWLLTNPTPERLAEQIDVRGWTRVEDLFGEPLRRDDDDLTLAVDSLGVRCLILTRD